MNTQIITIIGQGAYGSALGRVITSNGHTVKFFDSKHSDLTLDQALADSDAMIIAIPSPAVPDFLAQCPDTALSHPCISAVKGILDPLIFAQCPDIGALSGPAHAAEMNQNQPATLTATTPLARTLLETDWLHIELTDDLIGVMACGALKNCYAIGAGFLGLQPDTPDFDHYIQISLQELKSAIQILGGRPATADLACGIGDLLLTCGSDRSRNYQFGQSLRLAQAPTSQTTEGLNALLSLPESLAALPLLHQLVLLARHDSNTLDIRHIQPV
ncbi:hypothetical protein FWG86_00135 [Candidatus Saccharibacteria bacterium]|nr:hypothetical protein [Candidatus Saccharibacteria bacterium]